MSIPAAVNDGSTFVEFVGHALLVIIFLLIIWAAWYRRKVVKYVMDPRRETHKYFLLCLICLFIPGPYFHDSLVASFKTPILELMNISNSQFAALFAVSALTGIFCCPAGAAIQHVGRTRFAVGTSFCAAVGSTLTTLGFDYDCLSLMLVGRFVFWLSLNGLIMVQTILVYDLFEGKSLNNAMTFIVCSIRLGGGISYFVSGELLLGRGVSNSMWLSVYFVCGACLATVLFAYLFRGSAISRKVRSPVGRKAAREPFSLRLAWRIPVSVFFLLGGLSAVWGTIFPFEVIGDDMLQKDYGYSAKDAGIIIAVAPLISICSPFIAPFLGTTLKHKLIACIAGVAILMSGFVVLSWALPITGILIVGAGYAVSVCTLYGTLPLLISSQVPREIAKSMQSLVLGLNMVGSGLSMIVSNLVIGYIKDRWSYHWACVYLTCLAALGVVSILFAIATQKAFDPDVEVGSPKSDSTESSEQSASSSADGSPASTSHGAAALPTSLEELDSDYVVVTRYYSSPLLGSLEEHYPDGVL